jgi:hypothetical protein
VGKAFPETLKHLSGNGVKLGEVTIRSRAENGNTPGRCTLWRIGLEAGGEAVRGARRWFGRLTVLEDERDLSPEIPVEALLIEHGFDGCYVAAGNEPEPGPSQYPGKKSYGASGPPAV